MESSFLNSALKQFEYYKLLGEKTFEQIDDESLCRKYNSETNSIATIVKHLSGNMVSRWTDFLHTDGEKNWRNREKEFEETTMSRHDLINIWQKGWNCLFETLLSLQKDDLGKTIFIRNQGHSVVEAITRQIAHYAYHVGQIVFVGKLIRNDDWQSLSIPKGNSEKYNEEKFSKPQHAEHFTDEILQNNQK